MRRVPSRRLEAQFTEAILEDPDNEHAWLWLAEVSDDPGEQRYCLERALKINPKARRGLASASCPLPRLSRHLHSPMSTNRQSHQD